MKRAFLHGITAGLMAAAAAITYDKLYAFALMVDFSPVVNAPLMLGTNLIAGLVASLGYFAFTKMIKSRYADVFFNMIFTVLTFASLYLPMKATLPETVDPMALEFFFGLAGPLHLIPQLFWVSSKPIFYKQETASVALKVEAPADNA